MVMLYLLLLFSVVFNIAALMIIKRQRPFTCMALLLVNTFIVGFLAALFYSIETLVVGFYTSKRGDDTAFTYNSTVNWNVSRSGDTFSADQRLITSVVKVTLLSYQPIMLFIIAIQRFIAVFLPLKTPVLNTKRITTIQIVIGYLLPPTGYATIVATGFSASIKTAGELLRMYTVIGSVILSALMVGIYAAIIVKMIKRRNEAIQQSRNIRQDYKSVYISIAITVSFCVTATGMVCILLANERNLALANCALWIDTILNPCLFIFITNNYYEHITRSFRSRRKKLKNVVV